MSQSDDDHLPESDCPPIVWTIKDPVLRAALVERYTESAQRNWEPYPTQFPDELWEQFIKASWQTTYNGRVRRT